MPTIPAMTPGIRRCSLVISVVRPALVLCYVFVLYFDVIYFLDSVPFMFSQILSSSLRSLSTKSV
jgi:Na+/alanine symporter